MDEKKFLDKITRLANRYDLFGLHAKADALDEVSRKIVNEAAKKSRPTSDFIFPSTEDDKKGRFPIPDKGHGANAISRVNKYDDLPGWAKKRGYKSLQSLVDKVVSSVHSKFPGVEISDASSHPGKG